MKTVFISILQGVEARNILRTDIFRILSKYEDAKIVLLVPSKYKFDHYKKEFPETNRLKYEIINNYQKTFLDKPFSLFKVYLLKTETMDIKRRLRLLKDRNYFRYYISYIFNRVVSRRFIRRAIRFLDEYIVWDNNFKKLFDKYNPDLVFLAHLFGDEEISILREAKKRGVKSIGFVISWDKLTSRNIIRILPDRLIVPNDINKEEAIKYQNVPEDIIFVGGGPQFDIYQETDFSSKEEFCRQLGIDPSKKIILFCPMGRSFSGSDRRTIDLLEDFYNKKRFDENVHFIVRFPPNDSVDISNFDNKNFSIQSPGVRFSAARGVDWDMTFNDLNLLANTIYHSSLVISGPSTMFIDAAILDKPIIGINFGASGIFSINGKFPYYKFTHLENVVKLNGVSIAEDSEELLNLINLYLTSPQNNKKERSLIVKEQVGDPVYLSGKKIADFIISNIK